MYAFTTTGTTDFLQKIIARHHEYDFLLMKNRQTTAIYYESEKRKSIFAAGSTYSVMKDYLPIPEKGFVVMQTIPVARDSRKVFVEKLNRTFDTFTLAEGLIAARVLQAKKKDTFVIFMVWEKESLYDTWKDSEEDETDFAELVRKPTYFAERSFIQTYHIIEEDK